MKHGIECTKDTIDAALRENGRFELLKLLGKGSFGCVCQARDLESEEIVAIKMLPRLEVRRKRWIPRLQEGRSSRCVSAAAGGGGFYDLAAQAHPQLLPAGLLCR